MMLIQDEKSEEALVLQNLNKPHPGLHGLLKKDKKEAREEEGLSLLGEIDELSDNDEEKENIGETMGAV